MNLLTRLGAWLGLVERSADGGSGGILPPPRAAGTGYVAPEMALRIIDVWRAVAIYQTAAAQLSIDVERAGEVLLDRPILARRPSASASRSRFLAETVASLLLHGNAYWLKTRGSDGYTIINLDVLDPAAVSVSRDRAGRVTFGYDGRDDYTPHEIEHLKLLSRPGQLLGLGPIQAARTELSGIIDLRDYGARWFSTTTDVPSGVLSTDQQLPAAVADEYKRRWQETHDGGIRILGNGLRYDPILLRPEDAQWVESKRLSTTDIARLFGVPAKLMLAAIEGGSQTYSNVEQEWTEFVRFSLMTVLREIEEALTNCLPRGQTARFNIEALLRTDTKSRYEAHEIGLRAGFLTVDEVRAREGLPPLRGLPAAPAPADDEEVTA